MVKTDHESIRRHSGHAGSHSEGVNRARMQPTLTCITLDAQIMAGVADIVRLILDNGKALALFQAQQN